MTDMKKTNNNNEQQQGQVQTLRMQSTDGRNNQMPQDEVQQTISQTLQDRSDEFDPKKEQAILASFADPDVAQKASNELKKMGINTVQIDRVSPYPGQPTQNLRNPITGNIPSLGELTLGMDAISSRDAGVLMAADPSASGYATTADDVSGEDILLTAVVPKDKVEQAVQVIRSHGGHT
ncbi:hypothetical protein [Effusibacillus lacus]|uniref:Uncharacterized protein n=1 Tax=Effusibacillus lacus TaxID=1348429 RepID=A0A292YCG8_9BACL|nr:hypothetical protein [Effusibacillus lacus]TCS75153.1 hypothetical protein EDD64_10978 [Effusibacillus lacus]GAX89102.1 hypothetical protein EFBL_0716 [Effusibacillus lacus]